MTIDSFSFRQVTTFIFDIDGVLTDGTILLLENGLQARRMSIKDGYALQLAVKSGYRVLAVSGSSPSPVIDRLQKLGVKDVHMGLLDKKAFIISYLEKNKISARNVLYMGDDIPDLPAMSIVGISSCPADAAPEILAAAQYVSAFAGGYGCVRDVIEKVLRPNDHWHYHEDVASR